MSYYVGQSVDITSTFRNLGSLADPTEVVFQVLSPSGVLKSYRYSLGEVTRVALGVFRFRLPLSEADVWTYRFVGTGAVNASTGDDTLSVEPTVFPLP